MKINRIDTQEQASDANEKYTHPHFSIKRVAASLLIVLSTLFPADGKLHSKKSSHTKLKTETVDQPKMQKVNPKNGLDRITIHPDKDIELQRYRLYKGSSELAIKKKNQLMKKFPQLAQDIDPIESWQMFTLAVKESRLEFAKPNKSGAFGYSGLKPIAITHVDNILQKNGILIRTKKNNKLIRTYDPYKNHSDHILYMHLYFGSQQKELLSLIPKLPKQDKFWFTVAGYNAGVSRIVTIYNAANQPTSWNQFVSTINSKLLKVKTQSKIISEKNYGTKTYKDRFGGKDYTGNKKILIGGKGINPKFSTTTEKRYEIVRYVEMNRAIKEAIK